MTQVADDFNRAASTGLGANWVEDFGDFLIAASTLIQATVGGSLQVARWAGTAMASNNYDVQALSLASAGTSQGSGLVGRQTTAARTGYVYYFFGADSSYISYYNAGEETVLATGAAVTASTAYTARFNLSGSILTAYRNGASEASAAHGTLTSGNVGAAMYGGYVGAGSASFYIDLWGASDSGAAAGAFWGKLLALQTNRLVLP